MDQHAEIMFDQFYTAFLANTYQRKERWRITFTDGRVVDGIPWAQAMVSASEPLFTFKELESGRVYASPFRTLKDAQRLPAVSE